MGLLKALTGAAGGVLADQWKEYFYCEFRDRDVLIQKGEKKVSGRSSNTKGSENVITQGSLVAVNEGQSAIIVEHGKVLDVVTEPGKYKYESNEEPTVFEGEVKSVLGKIGNRFTFGGEAPQDQRIYFINTKEMMGNKYGTATPVPFRVIDDNIGLDLIVSIRCFGEYSYKITNPGMFYANVAGNVKDTLSREEIDSQLKSDLLTYLQPAFAQLSSAKIHYHELPGHTIEIARALNDLLSQDWGQKRGIEIESFGISSISASEEDENRIKDLQKNAVFRDANMAAAYLAGAKADAMKAAASNPNAGAAMAFMGMNMAGNAAGGDLQGLYELGKQQNQMKEQLQAQAAGKAPEAEAKPQAADGWTCKNCNTAGNTGKFCVECGTPKPADGWNCSKCGTLNKGKFCMECGAPKPAGVPQYKCDKCGWEPEDPAKPPKFCPECGDPFDDGDIL